MISVRHTNLKKSPFDAKALKKFLSQEYQIEIEIESARQIDIKNVNEINIHKYSKKALFRKTIDIFQKQTELRDEADLNFLYLVTADIKFFKKLREQSNGEEMCRKCLKFMKYEYHINNEIVFEAGSIGKKFFVILEGKVSVCKNVQIGIENQLHEINELSEGADFGEYALINNAPRLATILCKDNSHFAILDAKIYKKLLAQQEKRNLLEKINFIMSLPFFSFLQKRTISTLIYFIKINKVGLNQIIYNENDNSEYLYIIKEGEFKILKKVLFKKKINFPTLEDENIDKEKERHMLNKTNRRGVMKNMELRIIGKGEIFGYEAFKKISRRNTVICNTSTGVLYLIHINDFQKKMDEYNIQKELNEFISYITTQSESRNEKANNQMFLDDDRNLLVSLNNVVSVYEDNLLIAPNFQNNNKINIKKLEINKKTEDKEKLEKTEKMENNFFITENQKNDFKEKKHSLKKHRHIITKKKEKLEIENKQDKIDKSKLEKQKLFLAESKIHQKFISNSSTKPSKKKTKYFSSRQISNSDTFNSFYEGCNNYINVRESMIERLGNTNNTNHDESLNHNFYDLITHNTTRLRNYFTPPKTKQKAELTHKSDFFRPRMFMQTFTSLKNDICNDKRSTQINNYLKKAQAQRPNSCKSIRNKRFAINQPNRLF